MGLEINRVTWQMADQMFYGSGAIDNDSLGNALNDGIDGANNFIGNLRFMARMSPVTGARDLLVEYKNVIEDEQLRLANQCAKRVLERFPGLEQQLLDHHGDPGQFVEDYFSQKSSDKFQPPSYLSFVAYFIKDMQAWKNFSQSGSEFADSAYHNAHIKRHQMMNYINGVGISVEEQKTVDSIVDYDKSGPKFIDYHIAGIQ